MNRFGNRSLLLVFFLLFAALAQAAESPWRWVRAANNLDHGWDVTRGDAEVEMKDGQFSARLFWEGSIKEVQISLDGSMANEIITVKETVHNSDFSGSRFSGKLTVTKLRDGFTGEIQTITLTDGVSIIALTRTVGM